jgi:hypothetical protein
MTRYRVGVVFTGSAVVEIEADSAEEAQRRAGRYTVQRVFVERQAGFGGERVSVLEVRDPSGSTADHFSDFLRGFAGLTGRIEWSSGSAEPCEECLYCGWLKKCAHFADVDRRRHEMHPGNTREPAPASPREDVLDELIRAATMTPEDRLIFETEFRAVQKRRRKH